MRENRSSKKRSAAFFLFLSLLSVYFTGCSSRLDLAEQLSRLPGCTVEEIPAADGYQRSFIIDIRQPLDHDKPHGEKFTQRVFLNHRSLGSPFVMHTSGYSVKPERPDELTNMLRGNLLYIPHRYYEYAVPEGEADYHYLTIEQAAADHHRINELFRRIYKVKFVSTGRSKGGMTAFFYKYLYPEDVDVTVSIVAPIIHTKNDPRITAFLHDDPAKTEIIEKMKRFQRTALLRRAELAERFEVYRKSSEYSFSIPFDEILEEALLEIYIQFWQYGNGYQKRIPDESADIEDIFTFIDRSYPFRMYADGHEAINTPFYYQVYNEIGYYYFTTDHLEDLLLYKRKDSLEDYYPGPVVPEPDDEKIRTIEKWLREEGNNIIYIYGALDPFTACAVEVSAQTNALKIVQEGKSHVFPLISLEEYPLLKQTLSEWLEMEL